MDGHCASAGDRADPIAELAGAVRAVCHWKYTRTARKVMRRMLEHQWEHLAELEERLVQPV